MSGYAREIEIDDEWKQKLEEACDEARAEAIEDCAKIADQFGDFPGPSSVKMIRSMCATAIAEKIRALAVTSRDSR